MRPEAAEPLARPAPGGRGFSVFGPAAPQAQEGFWLSLQQLAQLFGHDAKTAGRHIGNALREELSGGEGQLSQKMRQLSEGEAARQRLGDGGGLPTHRRGVMHGAFAFGKRVPAAQARDPRHR